MTANPKRPIPVATTAKRADEAAAAITPRDISAVARDETPGSQDLAAMRVRFLADFADGTMGRQHNTYQHRSRVLARLAGAPPK